MTFAAILPAIISAAGSIAGGAMSKPARQKESKMEKTRRNLVNDLIASVKGNGPYSSLYQTDENAFNKSFVEPSKARFRNQIAPQIQQQFVASGQQRNSGLDDQLLRAGVDLDQMLNESYLQFQNQGKDRMQSALNTAAGNATGGPSPSMSTGEAFKQSAGGYLTSDAFTQAIANIKKEYDQPQASTMNPYAPPPRKGFEQDNKYGLPTFANL